MICASRVKRRSDALSARVDKSLAASRLPSLVRSTSYTSPMAPRPIWRWTR